MRQLKMFHVDQHDCCNCLQSYIPISKDVISLWERQFREELGGDPSGWAVDRIFDANMRFCSGACEDAWTARALAARIERIQQRRYGKKR